MNHPGVCWLDGEIQPLSEARLPVTDHGLLYGDGVFEGIRFYNGHPFRLEAHLQRLRASARAIALDHPHDLAKVTEIVAQVITAYAAPDGYLRVILTRGSGPLGIDPAACETPRLLVIAAPLQMVGETARAQGLRVSLAATRRLGPDGLDPRIKGLNYLNAILARLEANAAGADEALLLNREGRLAEGTADNLFLVREECLLTPPTSEGALAGITRALVLELAVACRIEVREAPLAPYDLYTADECFLTGTGAEFIPVREVDGRPLSRCPGPVFQRITAAFRETLARECGTGA